MGNRVVLPFSMKEIKVSFLGQIEQVKVSIDLKWSKFEKKLCSTYNLDGPLYARYHEDDKTPVFIETSSQLRSYLRSGKHQPLEIFPLYNGSSLPSYIPYDAYSIEDIPKQTKEAAKAITPRPTNDKDHSMDSSETKLEYVQLYVDPGENQSNKLGINHQKKSSNVNHITVDASASRINDLQNDDGSFEQWSPEFILQQLALSTFSSSSFHFTATGPIYNNSCCGNLSMPPSTCSCPVNETINSIELQTETQYLWSSLEKDIYETFIWTPTKMSVSAAVEDLADNLILMASSLVVEAIVKAQNYKLLMEQSQYWPNVKKTLSKIFT